MCSGWCVLIVNIHTSAALLRPTTASGAVSYHMFTEEDPPLRGPLPPIPGQAERTHAVPMKSNPAYQPSLPEARWLGHLQSGVEHTYEEMP